MRREEGRERREGRKREEEGEEERGRYMSEPVRRCSSSLFSFSCFYLFLFVFIE